MTVGVGDVPVLCSHATSVDVEDKTFVYDEHDHAMMVLNSTAAAIWAGCDGTRTVDQLSADLAARYNGDPGRVRCEVTATIEKFFDLGLMEARGEVGPLDRKHPESRAERPDSWASASGG
jgi:hypothetical protein